MATSPLSSVPETSAPPEAEFDLLLPLRSAGSLENPYPVYSLLRAARPVLQVPTEGYDGPGVWLLTRYEDVHAALRDPRFSVERMNAPIIRDNLDRMPDFIRQSTQGLRSMLVMDPPDHTRVRKLANKAFTPKRIAALRPRIEALVAEELDAIDGRSEFDLIHELAEPLPAVVIAELLGVPAEDHRTFRGWSTQLINALGAKTMEERASLSREAGEKILGYLRDVIAKRRADPRDDLISALIHAQEEQDALTDLELLATCNLLLLAGHETTTNLIGNGMLALLREPEQEQRLRADRGLLPTAVEELLRFDGPVQATIRIALEDIEVGDQVVPEGSPVILNIGAANHDPAVFDAPEELDLGRDPNPHLGFGFGAHFCMGAPLARLEAAIAFGGLLERFPKLSLVDEAPAYRENPVLRGLQRLDLRVG